MILGVAGKIAAGKTTVMGFLAEFGFVCIDADKIVHELYERGKEGQKKIHEYFGEHVIDIDGNVDRRKLGRVVFKDDKKLLELNKLIHPIVIKEIKKILAVTKNKNVAIEATYFEEGSLFDLVDKILFVERPASEVVMVLENDRKLDSDVSDNLLIMENKPKKIDYLIKNDGSLFSLKKKLIKLLKLGNI